MTNGKKIVHLPSFQRKIHQTPPRVAEKILTSAFAFRLQENLSTSHKSDEGDDLTGEIKNVDRKKLEKQLANERKKLQNQLAGLLRLRQLVFLTKLAECVLIVTGALPILILSDNKLW